jgi:antirestriction protein ArdC
METTIAKRDVYEIVTNRIIELLEREIVPWRQTWTEAGMPCNLITKKHYKGINHLLLNSLGYAQNSFLTFHQLKELAGSVKKGEKACPVIFYKWVEKEDKENTGKMKKIPFLRYYPVFNVAQCDGIPRKMIPVIEKPNDPIQACDDLINKMPQRPIIHFKEHKAYYHPEQDYINMPALLTFINSPAYYETLFHELVHSTGHEKRLNRKEVSEYANFGSESYSIEELTAEIGACYLKSLTGITTDSFQNNASYIQGWLKKLKNDKKLIIYASAQAQRATDFILGIGNEEKED